MNPPYVPILSTGTPVNRVQSHTPRWAISHSFESFREMQSYVGWTERDEDLLRALLPLAEAELPGIADRFYEQVLRHPAARNVFEDEAQVQRLKRTMQVWCRELLSGPWDEAYHRRRVRIGDRHVQVGLPSRFMFTAMNGLRQDLVDIAERIGEPGNETCKAIGKATDIDLAVMCGTYMDTRQQDALQTLQDLIVQNMPVTVLCLDAGACVTSSTRLGAQSALGRHVLDVLDAALLEQVDVMGAIDRVRASGNELTLPNVVVGRRHFRLTLIPIEHHLATVLLHIEELTDVVDAQSRAAQAESLAQLGSLAANVAHEIRNPLAAISATLQVIGGSFDEKDRRAPVMGKVNDQVLRLDRLVNDLLGFARPTKIRRQVLDLAALAHEAIDASGVSVEVEVVEPTPVVGDHQYLVQVLVNLLQNARDAADMVTLRVEGHRVTVQDDGPGVPASVNLFEPFVTTKAKGTGLGLAICRKLCRAMEAEVELAPGQPTRFVVSLLPASAGGSEAHTG